MSHPEKNSGLPSDSLFRNCDPNSLIQHLEKYLPTQILSSHPSPPNSPLSHYYFKGFDILFPQEINTLQQLLKALQKQSKIATRITEENEQMTLIKAPICIVFLKTGKGRAWLGPLRELPEEKRAVKSKNGRHTQGLNFEKYIFFEITEEIHLLPNNQN